MKTILLGDVINLEYGKPLPHNNRKIDGKYPAYGANGVKARTDKYYFDKPSIIVGRKGSAGELTLTEQKFWPLDVTYFVVYDEKKYDLKYIYNLLSILGLPSLAKGVKPGINRNEVYSLKIKDPGSIEEQRRIVKKLDEAFAAIDKAKQNTEVNLKNSQELFQSELETTFQNLQEEKEAHLIGEVCQVIGGGTPSKSVTKYYEGSIPWATVRDMNVDTITVTQFNITEEAVRHSSTNVIPAGNIVIATRVGLGKVCMLDQDTAINQDLRGIIPKEEDLTSEYLFWFFKSISKHIEDTGIGATVKGVKLPFIKNLQLPLLNLSEQHDLVKNLNELREQTQKLQKLYSKKLGALEELRQSILKRAFEGRL